MRKGKIQKDIKMPSMTKIRLFRRLLLGWYKNNGRIFPWRNKSATNYELIIAEILLQRTRAETVAEFYKDFVKRFPSWKKLAAARERDLSVFLRPIGLWRRRSRSLRLLANLISRRNGKFPRHREEINALPGVGQYIANAVLLLCYQKPQPLLDVNMARVLERVFGPRKLSDIRYDPYLQYLSSIAVKCRKPRELNWAVLDLAAIICKHNEPRCNNCPLKIICSYRRETITCKSKSGLLK